MDPNNNTDMRLRMLLVMPHRVRYHTLDKITTKHKLICTDVITRDISAVMIDTISNVKTQAHDDVIKWKYFPRYWPFVRGIHRSPVKSL